MAAVQLSAEQIEQIIASLQQDIQPYLIVLFGSLAKGQGRSDSDVDIAFVSDISPTGYARFIAAQALAIVLSREVDLVDLTVASTVMQAQIVTSGRVLYCTAELRRQKLFMRVLKEYALLNEARQPILERIAREGRIYER